MANDIQFSGGWIFLTNIIVHHHIKNDLVLLLYQLKPHSLCICKTDITDEVYDCIKSVIKTYSLYNLRITQCKTSSISKLVSVIVDTPQLCQLDIDDCYDFGNSAATYIANALSDGIRLTLLRLNYNSIGIDGFRRIMESVTVNTTLRELYINHIGLVGSSATNSATDVMIRTIPHIKSLRVLSMNAQCDQRVNEICDALEKNYTITHFYTCGFNNSTTTMVKIHNRNCHIRFAHRELLDIAFAFAPMILKYGCFDAYCMMWIFDYINDANIHVHEFKKIRIIRSVFEFYRRKIRDESSRAVSLCS